MAQPDNSDEMNRDTETGYEQEQLDQDTQMSESQDREEFEQGNQ